ncbi:MAG: TorF family putative porin [Motiliproteus sp.]
MKKFTKTLIAAGLISASVSAHADLSANLGGMTDYWFRGLDQATASGSIMGGLDYEHESGFYAGTWLASLTDDYEYDLYAGYNGSVNDFTYGVGVTGYYYDDFDGDFEELNLSAGYGPVSLAYAIGEYDEAGTKKDYTFLSVTAEYEGAYVTYGDYGDELSGDYFEVGYGMTYQDIDLSVAAIFPDDDSSAGNFVDDSNRVLFTFSKAFTF